MRSDKAKELLQVTSEDLTYVLAMGESEAPTPAELRRTSHVLRRLLLPGKGDNLLQRAAKHLRHNITFPSKNYDLALQFLNEGKLTFFQRGGAALWGVEYEGIVNGPAEATKGIDLHSGQTVELNLNEFLDEIVLGFHGRTASRREVVEYVANKAGGIHFDFNRQRIYAVLDQIREVVLVKRTSTGIGFEIHGDRYFWPSDLFTLKRDRIDLALAEIIATCRLMTKSKSLSDFQIMLQRYIDT